jgi:hypothetical protein
MTDTTTQPADTATASAGKVELQTIELSAPIVRGEMTYTKISLRKPKAGELRGGLTLSDIIGLDIGALLKLIPRITEPPLTDPECNDLDPADLTEIGGAIRGFFMTPAERRMLDAMIAEQQPKT